MSEASAHKGGKKEFIDNILIAFILAFVFRSFVTEPFVIPTGSMATTLLGAHMRFFCEDCGTHFTANYSPPSTVEPPPERNSSTGRSSAQSRSRERDPQMGDEVEIPSISGSTYTLHCPNCGFQVPATNARNPENRAQKPSVHYGDRILVLKYEYLLRSPQRWDVVVFKNPTNQPRLEQNYIKRLVGLPGEHILILDGDIYARRDVQSPWRLQRKPAHVQQALWRRVYDNDHQPQGAPRARPWENPWRTQPDSGWTIEGNTTTERSSGRMLYNGQATGELRFLPDDGPPYPLTDWDVYNFSVWQPDALGRPNLSRVEVVQDVLLKLHYERTGGDGALEVEMAKYGQVFTARLERGRGQLLRAGTVLNEFALPAGPMTVEMENLDYRVTVRINGQVMAQTDDSTDSPRGYGPDMQRLLSDYHLREPRPRPSLAIRAAGQQCRLSHVSIWRDVHYKNVLPGSGIVWGTPDQPIELGGEEYFVLGDNSALSMDARMWTSSLEFPDGLKVQSGRVPERLLLGKAFFVYWPAGFRLFGGQSPAIVPNFGDMRFIH